MFRSQDFMRSMNQIVSKQIIWDQITVDAHSISKLLASEVCSGVDNDTRNVCTWSVCYYND